MSDKLTTESILQSLASLNDPILGFGLVENGLISDIEINGGKVSLQFKSIIYGHPSIEEIERQIIDVVKALEGVEDVQLETVVEVPSDGKISGTGNSKIKSLIAVASGKGGVGKTTLSVNLAVLLAKSGAKVGLMDADVYGPNVPLLMGVDNLPAQPQGANGIMPAEAYGVKMISIGFMVPPDKPIIWRGPMLHSAIQQFIRDVDWGELDYLVVDLPPGTGDVQLSLAQTFSITGSVIVTLPQQVSLDDARRGLEMFRSLEIPVFGVVENMSYLVLPNGDQMDVFGQGGGKQMAEASDVAYLGGIPMDPGVRLGGDSGKPITVSEPDSAVTKGFEEITVKVALMTGLTALANKDQAISIEIN
jgi:ATP-binding protein involved in chromosome partitioning